MCFLVATLHLKGHVCLLLQLVNSKKETIHSYMLDLYHEMVM